MKYINVNEKVKARIKHYMLIIGYSVSITCFVVFTMMFFYAYSVPGKIIPVSINVIGEANFELLLLLICFPCVMFAFFDSKKRIKNFYKTEVKHEKY